MGHLRAKNKTALAACKVPGGGNFYADDVADFSGYKETVRETVNFECYAAMNWSSFRILYIHNIKMSVGQFRTHTI
jgi:hypothetical protein